MDSFSKISFRSARIKSMVMPTLGPFTPDDLSRGKFDTRDWLKTSGFVAVDSHAYVSGAEALRATLSINRAWRTKNTQKSGNPWNCFFSRFVRMKNLLTIRRQLLRELSTGRVFITLIKNLLNNKVSHFETKQS